MTFFRQLRDFLVNTANDERIPSRDKKILLALVALLLSPFDLIPDWIPVFGVLDDLVIVALILDYFFSVLDSEVLLSHFPWDMKAFMRLKKFARIFQFFVPKVLKKKLWKYVGNPY
jgi:uncharacterized membrane protein YkvA (DUF1232 family)